jgi:hypothetical protein
MSRRYFTLLGAVLVLIAIASFGSPPDLPATVPPDTAAWLQGGDIEKSLTDSGTVADTIMATPWVGQSLGEWSPDSVRAFCVLQSARWPAFSFLKVMQEIHPGQACREAVPWLIQLPQCPPNAISTPTPAAWVLVQCGPVLFRMYEGKPSSQTGLQA